MPKQTPLYCPITEVTESSPETLVELEPLLAHLGTGLPVATQTTFPRGTLMPDGRLDLCKQKLGPTGCKLVVDALGGNTIIKSLLLGTDAIGDAGAGNVARLVEANPHLEVIYLGCNLIGPSGATQLTKALAHNTSIIGLWLKRNPIGIAGAHALAAMLRQNRTIRTLDLVNTQIGDEGLEAILDVLKHHNRTIERLYLGGNALTPESGRRLADLLRINPAITALLLNVNGLGDQGALALADALHQNTTLQELGLASNGIGPEGGVPLLDAIRSHPGLLSVDLGYSVSTRVLGEAANSLEGQGAEAIGKLLAANTPLQRLDLRGNLFSEPAVQSIRAGLEQNTTLYRLFLNGSPHPRLQQILARNLSLHPEYTAPAPRDVALIKSVYRTV